MEKIFFDSSIHFGQFLLDDEDSRIACKNSQAAIAGKSETGVIGYTTFNETAWADHVIWQLDREVQDAFYQFMDVFHSVKQIERIPLSDKDAECAHNLVRSLELDISNALTCAAAISNQVKIVHTSYPDLLRKEVSDFMLREHAVSITSPPISDQTGFKEDNLEQFYQSAYATLKSHSVNLVSKLHQ